MLPPFKTKNRMKEMKESQFIKQYILPNENKEIILGYYDGNIEFDKDYLLEIAEENKIKIC